MELMREAAAKLGLTGGDKILHSSDSKDVSLGRSS